MLGADFKFVGAERPRGSIPPGRRILTVADEEMQHRTLKRAATFISKDTFVPSLNVLVHMSQHTALCQLWLAFQSFCNKQTNLCTSTGT